MTGADYGPYVFACYAVAMTIIGGLVAWTVVGWRKVNADLAALDAQARQRRENSGAVRP